MVDPGSMVEDPATGAAEPHADALGHDAEGLEQRVHRLEDAVAALQDTQLMEERITERIVGRINRKPASRTTAIVAAEQRTAPPAADHGASFLPEETSPVSAPARRSWVFVEVLREIRTMIGMFFDSRFRVSWSALFALLILAYVLVSSWLWTLWVGVPIIGLLAGPMNVTFIGGILDKAVDLFLIMFAYKILSREMGRYRQTLASMPASYSHY